MERQVFIEDLAGVLTSFVKEDGFTPDMVLRQLAAGPTTRVGEEVQYTLEKYKTKYGVNTSRFLEDALLHIGGDALPLYLQYLAPLKKEKPVETISIVETPLTLRADDGSVLAALQNRMYKDDQVDVGNPVKYLMDKLGVSPDEATLHQLVESMEAARIAEVNTAKNATSTFKARRFSVDEMIDVISRSSHASQLPKKKGECREFIKSVSAELKAEKGEHWSSTEFLKNVKVATAAHYGEDHMNKLSNFTDIIFGL